MLPMSTALSSQLVHSLFGPSTAAPSSPSSVTSETPSHAFGTSQVEDDVVQSYRQASAGGFRRASPASSTETVARPVAASLVSCLPRHSIRSRQDIGGGSSEAPPEPPTDAPLEPCAEAPPVAPSDSLHQYPLSGRLPFKHERMRVDSSLDIDPA